MFIPVTKIADRMQFRVEFVGVGGLVPPSPICLPNVSRFHEIKVLIATIEEAYGRIYLNAE